jgi:hypothetical protein
VDSERVCAIPGSLGSCGAPPHGGYGARGGGAAEFDGSAGESSHPAGLFVAWRGERGEREREEKTPPPSLSLSVSLSLSLSQVTLNVPTFPTHVPVPQEG